MAKTAPRLPPDEVERIIATAWNDKAPFHAVMQAHGIAHGQLVQLLKQALTPNAFKLWAARSGALPGRPGSAQAKAARKAPAGRKPAR